MLVGVVLLTSSGLAQSNIRLQFEVSKNDAVVAAPQVAVADGGHGSLAVPDIADISFSAVRTTADRVTVSFEIKAGEKSIRPRVVLVQSEPGSLSWKQGEDSLLIRVSVR